MNCKPFIMKLISFFVVILSLFIYYYNNYNNNKCSNGYFRIGDMDSCHEWLDCTHYKDMTPVMYLTSGLVKNIYLVKWKSHYLVLSNLTHYEYAEDFMNNIKMLKAFSPNPLIVQLIGSCNDNMLFTEYHSYGDATVLDRLLTHEMTHLNKLSVKLNLCISYVKILDFLHKSPIGTRVMCDSNTLEKTLSQYLVTNNLELVLNDLDALPEVKKGISGVKCGHRQLFGSFVAPEQLWPSIDRPFNDKQMPQYNEKTDIWKIPQVCDWFMNIPSDSASEETISLINSKLSIIHQKCKHVNHLMRPSAQQVLEAYQQISNELQLTN